jgi:type II secretory pathway component PulF
MAVPLLKSFNWADLGWEAEAASHGSHRLPDISHSAVGETIPFQTKLRRLSRKGKVKKQDVAEFTSQFAIMLRSGVDVATALGSLAQQCQRPALARVLVEVHEAVLSGSSLSQSLTKHPRVFDAAYVASVSAGEASGKMPLVLQQLSAMQRSEVKLKRTIKTLLTYPVLLMGAGTLVVLALVLFVLPRFAEIFADYELELPWATQLLLALAAELYARWWLWLPLVVGCGMAARIWISTPVGRRHLDGLWLSLPLIGPLSRTHFIGRTCRLWGLMLDSGVTLLDTLKITTHAIGNLHFQALILDFQDAVVNGRSLASVLEHAAIVPDAAREMLVTAEGTGKLAEVTQLLGEYYEEESVGRLRQLIGALEPAITIVMGAIVAFVVLAVMLPVFDLSNIAYK